MADVDVDTPVDVAARFSVRGLLAFTAGVGAVMAVAVALGSPEVPAVAAVVWIAWLTWRFNIASRGPLCVSVVGLLILIGAAAMLRLNPDAFAFFAIAPIALFGTAVMAVGGFSFLAIAFSRTEPRQVKRNVLAFGATVMAWCAWLFGGIGAIGAMHRAEIERRAVEDPLTLQRLVDDTHRIVKELGRAPENEKELESLLGRSLPTVYDGGTESKVFYQRRGRDSFAFMYELWATDDHIYDSTNPSAGWVQHYY